MKYLILTILFPLCVSAQEISIITLDSLINSNNSQPSALDELLKESVKQKKIENQLLENRLLGLNDLLNNSLLHRQNLDAIQHPYAVPSTYYNNQNWKPFVDSILRDRR